MGHGWLHDLTQAELRLRPLAMRVTHRAALTCPPRYGLHCFCCSLAVLVAVCCIQRMSTTVAATSSSSWGTPHLRHQAQMQLHVQQKMSHPLPLATLVVPLARQVATMMPALLGTQMITMQVLPVLLSIMMRQWLVVVLLVAAAA